MPLSRNHVQPRRASGLIRTFVVASATLAILLVCFAMYQYTQVEAPPEEPARPRMPSVRQGLDADTPGLPSGEGVAIGTGQVGPGREIKLTIYAPEGTRARFEIEVDDWTPRPGAVEEFILVRPRIRMRTRSGNAVRVTADDGLIEAQRRTGGSLDPRRGRLSGSVVIEYDRLTETERADLPPELRGTMNPRDIVRVEMNDIEFDLDYAKVVVPGRLSLTSVDAELIADDLSVNFNESENRVESLHIARGGRLLLRPTNTPIDDAMPGFSPDSRRDVSLVDWLRETIRERVSAATPDANTADAGATDTGAPTHASAATAENQPGGKPNDTPGDTQNDTRGGKVWRSQAVDESSEAVVEGRAGNLPADITTSPGPAVTRRPDGVYVFHDNAAAKQQREEKPVPYFARFEGDVDMSRRTGDTTTSRLQADWLEIWREMTTRDTLRTDTRTATAKERTADAEPPQDELILAWTGRLGVKALDEETDRGDNTEPRTQVTAGGTPARLAWPEGEAFCRELTYLPNDAEVRFAGDDDHPARLLSLRDGSFTGRSLTIKRIGDEFLVDAVGPGQLQRTSDWTDPSASAAASTAETSIDRPDDARAPLLPGLSDTNTTTQPQVISFRDSLSAAGRFIEVRRPDFTNLTMREQNERVIDRAEFRGDVRMMQDDVTVETETLTVTFASRVTWPGVLQQTIEHVRGEGDVVFAQNDDRLTCREIDVAMTTDDSGRMRPTVATAQGDVVAHQGSRSIRAREKLIMDMGPRRENIAAAPEDVNVPTLDRSSIALQRLRAFGEVAVTDPGQSLDVSAETLDCAFNDAGDIETAIVTGLDHRPASVRLDDFTVVGPRIDLNVPDEWAEVPDAGRLTILSNKNLDGQRADQPVPIIVTWTDHLRYQGRENRAVFTGGVHATSESGTTFDCERLLVEFDDVPREHARSKQDDPGFWQGLLDHITPDDIPGGTPDDTPSGSASGGTVWRSQAVDESRAGNLPADISTTTTEDQPNGTRGGTVWRSQAVDESRAGNLPADITTATLAEQSANTKRPDHRSNLESRFSKEPVYILATGRAVALTSDIDPDTGDVLTRTRISGPKLSVNLREEVSKMLIEGPGTLLLEDYRIRPDEPKTGGESSRSNSTAPATASTLPGGLLSDSGTGPSTTLIEWKHTMWYDFSIDQTRFEGDVELKHFSGAALQRMFNQVAATPGPASRTQTGPAEGEAPAEPRSDGRRTFLRCDLLTVDFLDRDARRKIGEEQRMGQISAGALRQFDARGAVQLQDETEGLTLWANQVIYERPRQILVIHGAPQQRARIIKSEPNRLPTQLTVMRLNYDLATGNFQILDPGLTGQ